MPNDSVHKILYTSRAHGEITDGLLLEILAVSRRNNAKVDVTGMLVARERRFLQLLEGDRMRVEAILKVIERDNRHTSVQTLVIDSGPDRIFPKWSMGYVDPKTARHDLAKVWPEVELLLAEPGRPADKIISVLRRFNAA